MKRKLLGVMILYVLGVAIFQNLGFSVFWRDEAPDVLTSVSAGIICIGEVDSCSTSASSYILHMTSMGYVIDDVWTEADFDVLCYMDEAPDYVVGDIISVSGTFLKPESPTNPGQFNAYIYYGSRGVSFISYQPDISLYQSLKDRQKTGIVHKKICMIRQWLYDFRCRAARVYDSILKDEDAGMLKGMILGDRSTISEELQELYRTNNISHILAISGLHIGLISGIFYKCLRRLGASYIVSGIVGMCITFSYGYMTGASDASMRAAIMLSVSMLGAMLGRTYDLLTAMSISVIIFVTIQPLKLYDAGFLFSYGAVIGIGAVYPCMESGLGLKKKLLKALALTVCVQLVTLPVSLYFYGMVAPYSIFLNLLVIPLVTPILLCGLTGGVLGVTNISMLYRPASWLLHLAACFLHLITRICQMIGKLPFASVILGSMKGGQMCIYYVCLLSVCGLLYMKRRSLKHALLCVCLLFLAAVQIIYRRPQNQVTMLDVGQGDSTLIQSKSGLHMLVDCGSTSKSNIGSNVLAPALQFYGIRRLDYVVATHADTDHVNGILYLLESSDKGGTVVDTLLLPFCGRDMEEYDELRETAIAHGVQVSYLSSGMKLVDEEISITCIHPSADQTYEDINDTSVVLYISYGTDSLLFTGDITMEAEEALSSYSGLISSVDILKVAHHGSKYSTSEEFLNMVSPELSLISCGEHNIYGHPHEALLNRLEQNGCWILLTPECGAIEITFEKKLKHAWSIKMYRSGDSVRLAGK